MKFKFFEHSNLRDIIILIKPRYFNYKNINVSKGSFI